MKRATTALIALLLLSACQDRPAGEPVVSVNLDEDAETVPEAVASASPEPTPTPTIASACSAASFEGVSLTHCVADPAEHRIKATLGPGDGSVPYGTLSAFAATVEDPTTIAFAMNGGAFSDDLSPRGYFVASGARLAELERGDGEGNFYLKPNGVFYGSSSSWAVRTTQSFYSGVLDRPAFGTQSGPMLLIGGELHPEISEDGNSRAIRNGVGVAGDGKAHFVISNDPLSYGQLARFFRDELKVKNALFLDSRSSSLWDPATGRMDTGRVGPIIVVSNK